MIKLRDYQQRALDAEMKHREEHPDESRLAIVMATGLGKGTIIAWRAVAHVREKIALRSPTPPGGRVLILAPTDEIVSDLAARCRLIADREYTVGIVKAEQDDHVADIIVASVQTLLNPERRARIQSVGLVIVDECEAYVAPEWRKVLEHFGCFPTCTCMPYCAGGDGPEEGCPEHGRVGLTPALGFTATLERGDGQGLGTVWQNVCFSRDISWGVRHGYLVQPVGHRLEIELPDQVAHAGRHAEGVFAMNAETQDAQLVEALAPEKIVEKWLELAAGLCDECREAVDALDKLAMPSFCPDGCLSQARPTVAFMPLVRSAVRLAEAFESAGVSAAVINGTMPDAERRWKLAAYAAGQIQVLVNAMVLTRGWDSPGTKCVIVGRPTKSRGLFVQMAGRGLRPAPGIPVEEQDCILITVADATADLCSVADLSDRPLDRKASGALTVMEDAWDLGADLADETRFWTGQVDAKQFDPLVSRSSKVWRATKHGTPYLPISKDGEYVFVVGTSVFVREDAGPPFGRKMRIARLHKDLPDLEMALQVAEDEAQERGGDLGRLLADKNRPWRKERPSEEMLGRAYQLGLRAEVDKIMAARAGGKAGKVSDLISRVIATRALEPMVERIKEATK